MDDEDEDEDDERRSDDEDRRSEEVMNVQRASPPLAQACDKRLFRLT